MEFLWFYWKKSPTPGHGALGPALLHRGAGAPRAAALRAAALRGATAATGGAAEGAAGGGWWGLDGVFPSQTIGIP